MGQPSFNPSASLRFDLAGGTITVAPRGLRALVPVEALLALLREASPGAARAFGQAMGREIGERVAGRLGDGTSQATLAEILDHLGGELALAGLGSLSIERWGKALVFCSAGGLATPEGEAMMAALLEGALHDGFGRDATVLPIDRSGDVRRYLVASPATARRVQGWLGEGLGYGDALGRLHSI
jgi:hypothetical protein